MKRKCNIVLRFFLITIVMISLMLVCICRTYASGPYVPYKDVRLDSWYTSYVEYVSYKKIMTGYDNITFAPNDNITRAMVVTVFWRMAGEPEPKNSGKVFPDVPTGKWYSKAVAWAKENKIIGGYNTGFFGTNDCIIRQDFVKILKGYADYKGLEIDKATNVSFKTKADAGKVSDYAKPFIEWAYQRNIIGQGSDLNPKGFLTRAETAAMITRFDTTAYLSLKKILLDGDCWLYDTYNDPAYFVNFYSLKAGGTGKAQLLIIDPSGNACEATPPERLKYRIDENSRSVYISYTIGTDQGTYYSQETQYYYNEDGIFRSDNGDILIPSNRSNQYEMIRRIIAYQPDLLSEIR